MKVISLDDEVEKYPSAKALLLDAYVKGIPGGTGKALTGVLSQIICEAYYPCWWFG